jgi:2-polyprenyl-6-methoxyphenol hydroxylase-like FAD-dependent oxidoreductase
MTSVLIVGAGPAGLTLACDLARRGVVPRVIDESSRLFVGSRAKGLQPRTLEVFEDLGVLDRILAQGAPFPAFRLYAGRTLKWERSLEQMLGIPAHVQSQAIPYGRAWLIPQWRTDRILAERFAELGGSVELGTRCTALVDGADGVTATLERGGVSETLRVDYLVGADGGRSFVRKSSGFTFEGETLSSERTLIGDARASGLEGNACHILTTEADVTSRFSLWNLPGSEYFQFVASLPEAEHDVEPSLAVAQELLERRSGRDDVRLNELRWASIYKVNVRMVDAMSKGRVYLVGDAAHVHSSAGGQGLNTAVQDSYNLGWKLAAVLAGASPSLLETYDEERLPVAARVLGLSSALHRRNFQSQPGTPSIYQLDINYRESSLALDERAAKGELRAGDRAPDALLPDGRRLFDALRGPHFTLLAFADGAPTSTRARVEPVSRSLAGYDVEPGSFVLIRPDGYIAAIAESWQRIEEYLKNVGSA